MFALRPSGRARAAALLGALLVFAGARQASAEMPTR
jgi:hypothetical protein